VKSSVVSGGSNVVDSGEITSVSVGNTTEDDGMNTSMEDIALEMNGVCETMEEVARDDEGGIRMVVGSGKIISSLEDGSGVEVVMKSLEAMTEVVVGETNTADVVSGKRTRIDDEVNASTIEEVISGWIIVVGADMCVDEGSGNMSMEEKEREGTGDGVKILRERVSSEEDIGMSRLFEDDGTTGLENTVLSGIAVVRSSEEKLGVGCIVVNGTSELLLIGSSAVKVNVGSMVGSTTNVLLKGRPEVADGTREVSGISRSLVKSGIVLVGTSINTVEDSSGGRLGSVEVWNSVVVAIPELIVGAKEDSVSSKVESEAVSGKRISELIAGAREESVISGVENMGVSGKRISELIIIGASEVSVSN
jgi:hypothetical protein